MSTRSRRLSELVAHHWAVLRDRWRGDAADTEPLRAELFSSDQMVAHGKRLASLHVIDAGRGPDRLLSRLAANERVLLGLGRELSDAVAAGESITPAAEWLLDNLYLVEEEIRTARLHLPKGYSRELPRLAELPVNGRGAGLPRAYALALAAISHADGRLGRGTLIRFIAAYQSVQPLKLGELWAIPIMLRLALIENLRRDCQRVAAGRSERDVAARWAARMLEVADTKPSDLILEIADMARSRPSLSSAFVAEFSRRLQGRGAALAQALTWIEQHLAEGDRSIEQLVQQETQAQAAAQVSVANSIGSLRLLGSTDWPEFVETLSSVEQALREDPADVYGRMDFASRDLYRHAVERLAVRSRRSETEVAHKACALAALAARPTVQDGLREAHVGHYLLGPGRSTLEQALGLMPSRWRGLAAPARVLPLYLGSALLVGVLLTASPLLHSAQVLEWSPWATVALGLLLLLATSHLALTLVNWLVTLVVPPRALPRMDYSMGITPGHRTLVVVPTLLGSSTDIERLVDALELRFLANRDAQLQFALLTDFHDAAREHQPQDAALIELASERIAALNARYGPQHNESTREPFLLLLRPRRWNAREQVWMGHERKRGKLADLNALLRGRAGVGPGERFSHVVGDTRALGNVRYVITLDSDTQLPRDSATAMVAAMAHPLNRPRFGTGRQAGIVVEGYGILQPRVATSLPSTLRSGYARLSGGDPGIDPYTRAVSDIYQDLFAEGSFIGKGIYDVDAFERALGEVLPDNRILSHDLLEGCHARAGLLSDVELLEDAPARYAVDAARRHRWTRGDWQLAGWLRARLHALPGRPRNPLSLLSQWKLFDNLRRSAATIALVVMLLLGWAVLPEPGLWTLRAVAILGLVPVAAHLLEWLRPPIDWLRSARARSRAAPAGRQLLQLLHDLACLPAEAAQNLDAIVRTGWRLLISRRRLLEWVASSELRTGTVPGTLRDLAATARWLWAGPALAVATTVLLAQLRPWALLDAAPLLLLWLGSPLLVWWIDRPIAPRRSELSSEQADFLRLKARRTWAFFEVHVDEADHHLPPDNMQEQPVARIAHRTSPTNIGFALLANVAAHEFGYLVGAQMLARSALTISTLERLERYRGHFFNWYDTQSLQPLHPRYISTVDSGNLAAALLTLRSALTVLADEPLVGNPWWQGLADTLALAREGSWSSDTAVATLARLQAAAEPPSTALLVSQFTERAQAVHDGAQALLASTADEPHGADDPRHWVQQAQRQCRAALDDVALLTIPGRERASEVMPSLRSLGRLGVAAAQARLLEIDQLIDRVTALLVMEQGFLYDSGRQQLTIGYNLDERIADSGHYDLLASEARLTVLLAIAHGQLPQSAWFALGRLLATTRGEPVLLSWSGSMFEYLMPALLTPQYHDTLLQQTCIAAVRRQIEYGDDLGLPWGVSESGYHATDTALNYQYRAFGVPGLGLKRGLAEDRVVAPHASMLALLIEPARACTNLQRLEALGAAGAFGFYEAVDYTRARLPSGQDHAVVRSFMAHHQGMGLLALLHALKGPCMQQHFTRDPRLQATLLLLQERVPKGVAPRAGMDEPSTPQRLLLDPGTPTRAFTDPDTATPEVHLLSNGSYHLMVTQAGGGYSRWKDLAVTRWAPDTTCDAAGSFCYLRDLDSGAVWSTAYQPTLGAPSGYQAILSEGKAEFRRRDQGIDSHLEIAVSPEDDVELRRLQIKNTSRRTRRIEVTSYCEVVLATAAADAQHPAFNKLFVQTEVLPELGALLCQRRPRAPSDVSPRSFHLMAAHVRGEAQVGAVSHETDRARFIGRSGTLAAPLALRGDGPLSNTAGSVLDPVAASRCVVTLPADETVSIDLVMGLADDRERCLALVEKYRDRRLADRVFELAWTHAQVLLRQLNASEREAQTYARLAGAVLYPQATLRAEAAVIRQNRRSQSGLWGYAISGDHPIVLVQIADAANLELVRQLVLAHAWWRLKGLVVDLVIWNEERDVYRQQLHEQILGLIAAGIEAHAVDRPGGIFVRHAEQIPHEDRVLLLAVARVVLSDQRGTLADQVERRFAARGARGVPARRPAPPPPRPTRAEPGGTSPAGALVRFNGQGGFSPDGREYVIAARPGQATPAPWVNVIANPHFGSIVSETGAAYTWCGNAHEFRLTPWHNDPVSDPSGERLYLRDEESGQIWSPTLANSGSCTVRHGFGQSIFEQLHDGIRSELTVFVALDADVKFWRLRLHNLSGRPRRLSATGYVEWVLGDLRSKTAAHIITERASTSGALLARNPFSNDHAGWVAFFDVDEELLQRGSSTCDRTEFIGRNGSLALPAALRRPRLAGASGAALDPCAALQVPVELKDRQSTEVVFRLGLGESAEAAAQLVQRWRGAAAAEQALLDVQRHWQQTLGAVRVHTPDPAFDALANGWLMYQTIACRLWARSGYYQSGGAFGFRDQLQDAMALVHCRPELLRQQLLLAASRQFVEGDVQHWWHPPGGRGVRTHISDDYLWLPLALCRYVRSTGDRALLDESVSFLEGRPLNPFDESYFDLPSGSGPAASVYEHARRAVEHGLRLGPHGLPLIGGGDWNDGLNLVGHGGRGESVWLGFFLHVVLDEFAALARAHGDAEFAAKCERHGRGLAQQLEAQAWDGDWYLRAWFDDGTALGSARNVECQIDSIAQSWSVLSGVASPERARRAMAALSARLIDRPRRLVRLLDPPFDGKGPSPGYISGYVPGVRENGGQYTHAAVWAAMAFAQLGDAAQAWEVLEMINPVNHARTADEVAVYKVEPYVVAADVYGVVPHAGRGGWSWYTGSAGWLYRLMLESVLGLRLEHAAGQRWLRVQPCLPPHWAGFEVDYRFGSTSYRIGVARSGAGAGAVVSIDGVAQTEARVPLVDDTRPREVRVLVGAAAPIRTTGVAAPVP